MRDDDVDPRGGNGPPVDRSRGENRGVRRTQDSRADVDALLLREGLLLYSAKLSHTALAFAAGVVVARALGPAGKGTVQLLWLVPQLAAQLLILGLHQANVYFLGGPNGAAPQRESALLWNSLHVGLLLGFLGAAGVALARVPLGSALGVAEDGLVLAAALVPLSLVYTVLLYFLLGRKAFAQRNFVEVTTTAVLVVALVGLLWGARGGIRAAVIARIVAFGVAIVIAGWALYRTGAAVRWTRLDPRLLRKTIGYGLRSQIGNVLQTFNLRIDMLFAGAFLGATDVGVYSVAVAAAEVLWFLPTAVGSVLFPTLAQRRTDGSRDVAARACRRAVLMTLAAAVPLAAGGRWLLPCVFGAAFADGWLPLLILIPGVLALSVHRVLMPALMSWGRPQEMSYAAAIALAATVALDLLLIPRWGIRGAAAASTVAYSCCAAYTAGRFVRVTHAGWRDVCCPRAEDLRSVAAAAAELARRAFRFEKGRGR